MSNENNPDVNLPKFQDHPDAIARRKMLEELHNQHPNYQTEPKLSLLKLLKGLRDSYPETNDQFHHIWEASHICNQMINLVKDPYAVRGPREVGQALALISHIVLAGLIHPIGNEAKDDFAV